MIEAEMDKVLRQINPNLGELCRSIQPPIQSLEDFLLRDNLVLAKEWRIPFEDIAAYKQHIANYVLFGGSNLKQWSDLPDVVPLSHNEKTFLETGFGDFDCLLQGGIPKGLVTGVWGPSNSGKTRISLFLALRTAMQSQHILFICTNNQVPLRLLQSHLGQCMSRMEAFSSMSPDLKHTSMLTILSHIHIVHVFDPYSLLDVLGKMEGKQYALVIVDSLSQVMAAYDTDIAEKFPATSTPTTNYTANTLIANPHPLSIHIQVLMKAIRTTWFVTLTSGSSDYLRYKELLDVGIELSIIPNPPHAFPLVQGDVRTRPPYFRHCPGQVLISLEV